MAFLKKNLPFRFSAYVIATAVSIGLLLALIGTPTPESELPYLSVGTINPESCYPGSYAEIDSALGRLFSEGIFLDRIQGRISDLKSPLPADCPHGVTVECESPPYFPAYHVERCKITFPPNICPPLPNGPRSPFEWLEFFEEMSQTSSDLDGCVLGCIGLHEAIHARDFSANPEIRMCLSELYAYARSRACLKDCDRRYCAFSLPDVLSSADDKCRQLHANLRIHDAAYDVNMCLCNYPGEPCGPDDSRCASCRASCEHQHSPALCDLSINLYCRPLNPATTTEEKTPHRIP
ncbi:MAG: hypothetical protein RL417_1908 [Pseudomonadota bacterium]